MRVTLGMSHISGDNFTMSADMLAAATCTWASVTKTLSTLPFRIQGV